MASSAQIDRPSISLEAIRARFAPLIPRSLGTRLALTYSALAVLIVAALGWSLLVTIREFSIRRLQSDLIEETVIAGEILSPLVQGDGASAEIEAATKRLGEGFQVRVTVVAADGTVLADSARDASSLDNHASREEIQEALQTGVGSSVRPSSTMDMPYFFVSRRIADGTAVVRMGMPVETVDGLIRDVQRQVAVAAILAGALMTAAGLFVAQRIGNALGEIQRQAAAVASGRLDVSVDPAPTQELGDLGRAFNTMTVTLRGTLAELERVRARLEATLADLSDGVVITDSRGHVLLANDSALELLAVHGAVTGEPFVEVGRDHELADLVDEALQDPGVAVERVIHHGRSGKILQAAARRLDAANQRIGVVVLRDLTELRRLEGMRRDFVANVSHELRTPLTSIRALVETLEAGALHDPTVSYDFLSRIISEVDRLALLVDDLLDLARLESGRVRLTLERIEPESVLRRVGDRLAPQTERARLTVGLDLAPEIPTIVGDRDRIDQVLLNLVHNAIKFTPSGGTITLTARPAGEFVEFQVRDTGVGVDPEELPRLFERFYKADRARRSQGTGLGLAIAKHIVQVHGGTIWAEPNVPAGTIFSFRLPIGGPVEGEAGIAPEEGAAVFALSRDAI
jgi:two-component system, OmpR family, phosphate regulon sensor histidine kinase PhoR